MGSDPLAGLPLAVYPGSVRLVRTEAGALRARLALRRERVVGLDTESRPSFRKGEIFPIALVQVATDRHAFLFRVRPGSPPRALKRLLEDPAITKIVQGAPEEIRELRRDLGIEARGFVDLPTVARQAGCRSLNLRALAADVLGLRVSKSAQRSDWSREPLTQAQIEYAAVDAWAALAVWRAIQAGRKGTPAPRAAEGGARVRAAGPSDAAGVARLIRELAREMGESSEVDETHVHRWLKTPGCGALVAEGNDGAAGVLTWSIRPNLYHASPVCQIEELVVGRDARRSGVGRALVRAAVDLARERRCAEISVSTLKDNRGAQALYREAGLVDEAVLLERHFHHG